MLKCLGISAFRHFKCWNAEMPRHFSIKCWNSSISAFLPAFGGMPPFHYFTRILPAFCIGFQRKTAFPLFYQHFTSILLTFLPAFLPAFGFIKCWQNCGMQPFHHFDHHFWWNASISPFDHHFGEMVHHFPFSPFKMLEWWNDAPFHH